MKRFLSFLLAGTLLLSLTGAAPNKDVRLYNLEKEYRKLSTMSFRPANASALELQLIVENMLSIYGNVYVNEKDNALYVTDTPEMIQSLRQTLQRLDKKGITAGNNLASALVPLNHVVAADVINLVRHKLSKYGTILNYSDQNALLVTDILSKIEQIRTLVAALDKPVLHIEIEVAVAEVNLEKFAKTGVNVVQWLSNMSSHILVKKGDGISGAGDWAIGLNDGIPHQIGTPASKQAQPATGAPNSTFIISAKVSLSDLISLMEEDGKAKVLASPRIITKNNNSATLASQEIIPRKFVPAGMPGSRQPGPQGGLGLTGISLQVLPVIQHDSTINMQVYPRISDLTGWDPKGMPIVFERLVNTEVTVKSGETFVLGGLRRTEKLKQRSGVPILKDIPFLRFFFSTEIEVELQREVVVFIKPTILSPNAFEEEKNFLGKMGKEIENGKQSKKVIGR